RAASSTGAPAHPLTLRLRSDPGRVPPGGEGRSAAANAEGVALHLLLPDLLAGAVELVDAAVVVAGDKGVPGAQADGRVGVADRDAPVHLAAAVDLLNGVGRRPGDQQAAAGQFLDAAPVGHPAQLQAQELLAGGVQLAQDVAVHADDVAVAQLAGVPEG